MTEPKIDYLTGPWKPQPGPQTNAIRQAYIEEMLYGGARGGGKTAWLLGDFGQDVPRAGGSHWHGILFRRTYGQLEEVIKQSLETYPRWFDPKNQGHVVWMAGEKTWKWRNGATLKLRYAESDDDWMQYHGHQYTWIGWDELTTWSNPELYLRMKATLRSAHPDIKHKRIRATANPGGPGHSWVKEYFGISDYPDGGKILLPEDGSKMRRIFIKSKVSDNKVLTDADPEYASRLKALGSPELVRAWLDGDWEVVQGAYFPEFSAAKHVIQPFPIPPEWTRIRCMDWGSAQPFAIYWIAIADGSPIQFAPDLNLPKGAMVVYREWYGTRGRNVGLGLTAEQVADGIVEREVDELEGVHDAVLDPSAFAQAGGPSIAERMARHSDGRVMFRRGDNKRIPGWEAIRSRLVGTGEGPMLYVFSTCPHLRTGLATLQHDPTKPEDADTDGEDHACDALRYGCMARPWARTKATVTDARFGYRLDDLWAQRDLTTKQHQRHILRV